MNGQMLTCKELVEFLWRYLEDELSPEERVEFDRHLATCPCCGTYLETYRVTVELGHEAFTDPEDLVPADVPEDLVRGILAARRATT